MNEGSKISLSCISVFDGCNEADSVKETGEIKKRITETSFWKIR